MDVKEMKAMEGTPFLYELDGATIEAYVKKFDENTGKLSCWSLGFELSNGEVFVPFNKDEEKEGAVCVLTATNFEDASNRLQEIKYTGKYSVKSTGGSFYGCVF